MINLHKKVYFGSFCAFRELWKSTVIFIVEMTPVIISKWISKLYEDFEKRFRIPTNLVGEPPQIEAQPPLAVAK
jgi:hypothetical protein